MTDTLYVIAGVTVFLMGALGLGGAIVLGAIVWIGGCDLRDRAPRRGRRG